MNLKFKDYICVIVPPLLCIVAYCVVMYIICATFNLSDVEKTIMAILPTILLSYPGIKLMYKYFDWYTNKYMEE